MKAAWASAGRCFQRALTWTVRARLLSIALVASVGAAEAQGPPVPPIRPGPPASNYVAWRDGYVTPSGIAAWDHEPANRQAWREQVEGYWAAFDGPDVDYSTVWVFLVIGDSDIDRYDLYEARWVAECLANRDIVIPYPAPRRGPYFPQQSVATTYLSFAVFAAGAPAAGIERVLRYRLPLQGLTSEEIETVVQTYRALYPPD